MSPPPSSLSPSSSRLDARCSGTPNSRSTFDFQLSNCELRISNCEFRISNFELRIANFEFRIASFKFQISTFEHPRSSTSPRRALRERVQSRASRCLQPFRAALLRRCGPIRACHSEREREIYIYIEIYRESEWAFQISNFKSRAPFFAPSLAGLARPAPPGDLAARSEAAPSPCRRCPFFLAASLTACLPACLTD